MQWMTKLAMILVIATAAVAASSEVTGSLPVDAQTLDRQMRTLLLEREQNLTALAKQAKSAPLSERTARDAEYAAMQVQYEVQLLELMVQYYEASGNEELRNSAAQNLAQILASETNGTLESAPTNRSPQSVTTERR